MTALIEPSAAYLAEFLAAEREFVQAGGERIINQHAGLLDHPSDYLTQVLAEQGRQPAEPSRVAASVFWLVDGETYVGRVNMRHRLNPRLRRVGGHIGYEIRPSMRRRGYGAQALALAMERARDIGLRRVLLVCADDNIGSQRIIEANGGVLEGTFRVRERSEPIRRYWIDLRRTAPASGAATAG
jgi:predicted acetyltransferase